MQIHTHTPSKILTLGNLANAPGCSPIFRGGQETLYKIIATLPGNRVVWCGWFEDVEDCHAFLFAAVSGSLDYQKELWRLPTPYWEPFPSEELSYHFATVTYLTVGPGINKTYTSPSDWNNSSNTIECVGGGGGGGVTRNGGGAAGSACGGGGGQYAKIANFSFATPGTTTATYIIGTGGTAVARSTNGVTAGNAGTITYFNASADPGAGSDNSKCSAQPGLGGAAATNNTQTGGTGGTGGWGQTLASGGRGGSTSCTGSTNHGTGGGGAGGPDGAGLQGGDLSSSVDDASAGGNADNSSDGTGGSAPAAGVTGNNGGNGTKYDASHGLGGGGSGAGSGGSETNTAGNGGNYGGGAGGIVGSGAPITSGTGAQGLIVVTYSPSRVFGFGLAMMGM